MKRPGSSLMAVLAACLAFEAGAQNRRTTGVEVPTLRGFSAPIRGEGARDLGLVTGREAKPSLGDVDITLFRLETYRYEPDKTTNLVIESPQGVFGPSGARSGQPLTLRGDGDRFVVTGRGWTWDRAAERLVISNDVRIAVRRRPEDTQRPPIAIRCRQFEYHLKTGDARFLHDCVAEDEGRARVMAGEFVTRLGAGDTKPQSIVGTNGVTIELLRPGREGRASGRAATYVAGADGEEIRLIGEPRWNYGPGEGSADELVLRPSQDAYTARGNARIKVSAASWSTGPAPRDADGEAAPADEGANVGPKKAREPIEIECRELEGGPESLVFEGPVQARQGDRMSLRAGRLTASLAAGPASRQPVVTRALASGGVTWRLGSGTNALDLRGDEMIYTLGEHPLIDVRGDPGWKGEGHEGTADRFIVHPDYPSFEAVDRVRVTWRSVQAGPEAMPIEVRAARLAMADRRARFTGGVEAAGPSWGLRAAELELGLGTGQVLRELRARNAVEFDYWLEVAGTEGSTERRPSAAAAWLQGSTEEARRWRITGGEIEATLDESTGKPASFDLTGGVVIRNVSLEATGGRMEFRSGDGLMRLRDDARLRTTNGVEIVGEPGTALVVDPRSARFGVEGAVKRMVLPARLLRAGGSAHHSGTETP